MALPNQGPLRFSNIQQEFGGTKPSLAKYYRRGTYVADIPDNLTIPMAGRIRVSNFYGTRYFLPGYYELTIDQSAQIDGSDFFWYGYFNGLSTPYTKVTHRNWQNAWSFNSSFTLKKSDLTSFTLDPFQTGSYGALQTQSSGTFTTGYATYALPFVIPKLNYKEYAEPDQTTGYNINNNEMMVQLIKNNGRLTVSLAEAPSSANGYTTIVLCDDDGAGANAFYSFSLVYRWIVSAP